MTALAAASAHTASEQNADLYRRHAATYPRLRALTGPERDQGVTVEAWTYRDVLATLVHPEDSAAAFYVSIGKTSDGREIFALRVVKRSAHPDRVRVIGDFDGLAQSYLIPSDTVARIMVRR